LRKKHEVITVKKSQQKSYITMSLGPSGEMVRDTQLTKRPSGFLFLDLS